MVEIDPETGGVRPLRHHVGYEVGRAVDRRLVEGQLVGGVAQGIGGALLEEFRYDDDRASRWPRRSWTTCCPPPPRCRR